MAGTDASILSRAARKVAHFFHAGATASSSGATCPAADVHYLPSSVPGRGTLHIYANCPFVTSLKAISDECETLCTRFQKMGQIANI